MADLEERSSNLEYLERLPTVYSAIVQLDPGHLGLTSVEVRGRDSFIIRSMTGARSIWTTVPEADWVGYIIPITWKGEFILNGMSATPYTVFSLDGAHEFDFVAEHRDAITVGIRKSVLSRTISGLIGRDFSLDADTHRQQYIPTSYREWLLRLFRKPLACASSKGPGATFGRLPRSVELATIEATADWIIETAQLKISETANSRRELKIVRDSIRKIRGADCSLVTVADLCHMSGVGKSRLHQAFSDIYRMSPGAYLHRLRLTSIREKLLSEEAPPRSVKDVAIQHGFLSSGQFARAYRGMFGELPSQTLSARNK
ncbi:helix-turn-helix domain-containing protein [uncultured Roseibium sp.]|uniref:helix-turn-helix domain-containing protein n=1 Tax=uncultured Roseibium sp. TaxID=1936171 RepID=UPI0032164044